MLCPDSGIWAFPSIANILGAVKYAKYMDLGPDDAVITVATDGAEMYATELDIAENRLDAGRFDTLTAAEVFGRHLLGAATDHTLELDRRARERIFNLGYYTWVEQQGISLEDFDGRRDQAFLGRANGSCARLGRNDRGVQHCLTEVAALFVVTRLGGINHSDLGFELRQNISHVPV